MERLSVFRVLLIVLIGVMAWLAYKYFIGMLGW